MSREGESESESEPNERVRVFEILYCTGMCRHEIDRREKEAARGRKRQPTL